jgi:hypothetical protein
MKPLCGELSDAKDSEQEGILTGLAKGCGCYC